MTDRWVSLFLGLCCLLVYNLNGRAISSGDAFPARYQPFAILGYHTVLLDPVEAVVSQGRTPPASWQAPHVGAAYWMIPTRAGHVISLYSPVLAVLVAPLYVPAAIYLHARGWTDERVDIVARVMEKVSASVVASLSVALLYVVLRRRTSRSNAVLLAVAYAFGTTTWVIGSQALWQHGMGQLLIVIAMLLLTGPCTAPRAFAAGVVCALIAGNRPPDAVLALPLGLYALFWAGRRADRASRFEPRVLLVAAALLSAAPVLLYNLAAVGTISGAYALVGHAERFFANNPFAGLAGLLFSPTRGLFVFSPFLLFLALAWRYRAGAGDRGLTVAMAAGVALQVLLYSFTDWRGGISWGPRFMTDLLPILIWMLAPVVAALRRPGRAAFVTAVAVAIAIEAVGAFAYTGVTDLPIYAAPDGPGRLRPAWEWRNAPFIASLSRGRAPAELLTPMRGSIDAVEAGGRVTDTIAAGEDVVATGWAVAGHAPPLQVAITIDGDESGIAAVREFHDRPDIRRVLPGNGPVGWRIPLKTAHLPPGRHQLSLYSWASEQGDVYYLARRTLNVQAAPAQTPAGAVAPSDEDSLEASARTAAARIREHQQGPGYWLTAFTGAARFEQPRAEMNTFLTSLLVDLLDPVAASAGLSDSLRRARQHLTAQIEADGLVRYHGLPDAPGIGTLGCVITPDADDTALVWRIAPVDDPGRLAAALTTTRGYRTAEGLYRTWLAPRAAYQCLDPGRDPNPTDIAIQLHMLQWLLRAEPPAGRALCAALSQHLDDDRIWVYYRVTPLVPMLRTASLARAGCRLRLPESRMRTEVPGQEIWVALVRLLLADWRGAPASQAAAASGILRQLAADDFALLRQSPPLLYHNDLSATVPRYYWSADAGYALWLRLDTLRSGSPAPPAAR